MSSEQPGERNIQNQEDEKARRVDDGGDAGGADESGELPADRREEKQSEVPESRNAEQPVRRRVPPNPEHDGGADARAATQWAQRATMRSGVHRGNGITVPRCEYERLQESRTKVSELTEG